MELHHDYLLPKSNVLLLIYCLYELSNQIQNGTSE